MSTIKLDVLINKSNGQFISSWPKKKLPQGIIDDVSKFKKIRVRLERM